MKRIHTMCWAMKLVFLKNPLKMLIHVAITIAASIVPAYLAVYIGDVVNSIAEMFTHSVVNWKEIGVQFVILGFLLILNTFFFYGSGIITSAFNEKVSIQINEAYISAARNISVINFEDADFCDRLSIAKEGVQCILPVTDNLFAFIGEILSFAVSIIIVTRMSYYLTILVLIFFFIGFGLNMWSKKIRHNYWMNTTTQRRQSDYISDLFFSRVSAKEIRTLKTADFLYEKWFTIKEQLRNGAYVIRKKSEQLFSYYHLFMDISNIFVLIISLSLVRTGKLAVGGVITLWLLNKNLDISVQTINSTYSDLFFDIEKVAEAKKFMYEFSGSPKCRDCKETDSFPKKNLLYELQDVSFSYLKGKKVLKNINLSIQAGEMLAICGANGSGKSTLIKLLLGLYSPDQGEVRLYGRDVNDMEKGYAGIAFQDYICYPFSYRENVGFGYLQEINDDNAIRIAAVQGGTEELLEKYGIDQQLTKAIDNGGTELSGGEWQRIALSRANMGQKKIMVFDEPAAKLDPLAEYLQFLHMQEILKDRAVILISHRIGFARQADRIIVMKDGEIVEDGTHDSLIRLNGEYKKMFQEQAQWYDTQWGESS